MARIDAFDGRALGWQIELGNQLVTSVAHVSVSGHAQEHMKMIKARLLMTSGMPLWAQLQIMWHSSCTVPTAQETRSSRATYLQKN